MLTPVSVAIAASCVRNEANVGDDVGIIVEVTMPRNAQLETLSLSSVTIQFSGGPVDWAIEHDDGLEPSTAVTFTHDRKANLRFQPGRILRLVGNVTSVAVANVRVSRPAHIVVNVGILTPLPDSERSSCSEHIFVEASFA
jgi:hypothetical protein